MTTRKTVFAVVCSAAVAVLSVGARGQTADCHHPQVELDTIAALAHARVTLLEAVDAGLRAVPGGQLASAGIHLRDGRALYRAVVFDGPDVRAVEIDARNAEVVSDTSKIPAAEASSWRRIHAMLPSAGANPRELVQQAERRIRGSRAFSIELEEDGRAAAYGVGVLAGNRLAELHFDATSGRPVDWHFAGEEHDAEGNAMPKKATDLDTAAIESITGLKGTLFENEPGAPVFKVTQGRTDVPITVEGRKMEPFMGFTSWAAFRSGEKAPAMMAGDLVLFQDEVSPVMDALFANGCTVTALHNHFFFDEPKVYFMHIGGEGKTEDLSRGVRAALDAVKSMRAAKTDPKASTGFGGGDVPTTNSITPAPLDAILFPDGKAKGAVQNGMYKATIGRTVQMSCGCTVGNQMGINTWAAFCGSDESAAVAGDFITFEGELQPVLRALRGAGIHVVAIHNHMEGESPTSIFLHYWGKGRAEDLARGVQSALEAQAKAGSGK